jgi:hypothetical protein
VADLKIEAEKVRKSRLLGGIEVGTFVVSLGAYLFSGDPLVSQIAGIVGGVDLLELIRHTIAHRKEKLEMRKSDVYLLYLLQQREENPRLHRIRARGQ